MNLLSGSRFLLLSFALLLGCRSEKAAFDFQPAAGPSRVASVATAGAPAAASETTPAAPEMAPATQKPASKPVPARPRALAQVNPARLLARVTKPETQGRRALKPGRKLRQAADDSDIFHAILGALLIIGGVILGLLLGGWLGLGVGAAVVIAGYYFLVLSFGGPHAWLEIFQEFFNM